MRDDGKSDNGATISSEADLDSIIDSGAVEGGTLRLFCTKPDTLNPVLTQNSYVQECLGLVFESLVKLDKNYSPVPVLSDEWEVSSDGLVWTFSIRDGVYWHDGYPLTSDDVEFTANTILSLKANSIYKSNFHNVAAFSAIGRNSFKIILKKSNSFTPELMTFPIIPKHIYEGKDFGEDFKELIPVGTGPYKILDYDPEKSLRLVQNNRWINTLKKEETQRNFPYIEQIDIKIYKDAREAINAFQTRDIDVIQLRDEEYNKYSGRADLVMRKYPGRDMDFIAFNVSSQILKDNSIRQAITLGIDKDKIANEIYSNQVTTANLPVIPGTWIYNRDETYHVFNPLLARDILEQNGWVKNNNFYSKKINRTEVNLELELLVNQENSSRINVAHNIKSQLEDIGIKINVKTVKWDEEFDIINSRKFDMALLGGSVQSIPDISSLYSSSYIPPYSYSNKKSLYNVAGYDNNDVSNYIKKIFLEPKENIKKALFFNMGEIIKEDPPYIVLYFYNNAMLYNKGIRGNLDPYFWDKFNNIAEWYITPGSSK